MNITKTMVLTVDETSLLMVCIQSEIKRHYRRMGEEDSSVRDIEWRKKEISELERVHDMLSNSLRGG